MRSLADTEKRNHIYTAEKISYNNILPDEQEKQITFTDRYLCAHFANRRRVSGLDAYVNNVFRVRRTH